MGRPKAEVGTRERDEERGDTLGPAGPHTTGTIPLVLRKIRGAPGVVTDRRRAARGRASPTRSSRSGDGGRTTTSWGGDRAARERHGAPGVSRAAGVWGQFGCQTRGCGPPPVGSRPAAGPPPALASSPHQRPAQKPESPYWRSASDPPPLTPTGPIGDRSANLRSAWPPSESPPAHWSDRPEPS